jgi:UDP-N-acetylmuramoyl-tripeptide--D-alanyl-D-alanine ligase
MKELGAETDSAHAFVGEYAAKAGVTELWAVGEKSKLMVAAFKAKGRHFSSKDELLQALISIAGSEMTVLIKGSRAARMDDIVMALKSDGEN